MMRHKNAFKILIMSVLCCMLAMLGCARTADSGDDNPSVLTLRLVATYAGAVDVSAFNYYFAFSGAATPTMNQDVDPSATNGQIYYPTPGRTFEPDSVALDGRSSINFYYQNFFKTWSDYVTLDGVTANDAQNQATLLFKSDSTGFDETTSTENTHLDFIPEDIFPGTVSYPASNKIQLDIIIQNLSLVGSNTIYVGLATATKSSDGSQAGVLRDVFGPGIRENINIAVQSGAQTLGGLTDDPDVLSFPAIDITSVELSVF